MQFGQRSVRQGSEVAAGPSTCGDWKLHRISERLTCRVKGLTADFWVLLVTNPPRPARWVRFRNLLRLRQNVLVAPTMRFRTAARQARNDPKPGRSRRQDLVSSRPGFVKAAAFSGSTVLYPTAKDRPATAGGFTDGPPDRTRFTIRFATRSHQSVCVRSAAARQWVICSSRSRSHPYKSGFAGMGTNHPFTMTMNAAVLSTKSFTPQVPLYHCPLSHDCGDGRRCHADDGTQCKSRQ